MPEPGLESPPTRTRSAVRLPLADDADAEIVAAAQHDRQAFAGLYRRYVDAVYRYCYHRLGSREAAEDATSQVLAKALAALPAHPPDRSFRSWLFAIAHNAVIDDYRSRRPTQPLAAAMEQADTALTPEDIVIASERQDTVRALLAQLPRDQRRVLELRLAGLTGREIAIVLGRSLGSVKIAQVRAYVRLRQLLGVVDGEEARHGER